MEALKQRIQRDGKIRGNNEVLKVDSFLNHQMDVAFLEEIGREFRRRFAGCQVDRILTIEASGIGIACLAAPAFDHVPVVFAKKNKTKNTSSFRSFPLTDDAMRLFKILLQQEQYYRNHYGKDYIDNDYVFTWEDGHPYSPDYVSHTFHKLLKKYDLPHIRFHDLRHTCASMLLSEGYGLKDVQEWLGHSDIKMTANIYGHLDIRRKRSIANGLEQALPRLKP